MCIVLLGIVLKSDSMRNKLYTLIPNNRNNLSDLILTELQKGRQSIVKKIDSYIRRE